MGFIFDLGHDRPMAARTCKPANPDDAECQRNHWGARARCSRALPMDADKRCLPQALSGTVIVHPKAWRFSTQSVRFAAPRISTWPVLCWLLLGSDGLVVRRRDHERAVDRGNCHLCLVGKDCPIWPPTLAHRGGSAHCVRDSADCYVRNLRMSALGQKQTFAVHQPMSALPSKADMTAHGRGFGDNHSSIGRPSEMRQPGNDHTAKAIDRRSLRPAPVRMLSRVCAPAQAQEVEVPRVAEEVSQLHEEAVRHVPQPKNSDVLTPALRAPGTHAALEFAVSHAGEDF